MAYRTAETAATLELRLPAMPLQLLSGQRGAERSANLPRQAISLRRDLSRHPLHGSTSVWPFIKLVVTNCDAPTLSLIALFCSEINLAHSSALNRFISSTEVGLAAPEINRPSFGRSI